MERIETINQALDALDEIIDLLYSKERKATDGAPEVWKSAREGLEKVVRKLEKTQERRQC
jgi:hypothetical protein